MTRLTGVRTLDDLKARCWVDETSGCWHWRMATSEGAAKVYLPGLKRVCTGLFAAATLSGRKINSGQMAYSTCTTPFCLCPAHTKVGTWKQWGAWKAATGSWKAKPQRIAACQKTARSKLSKLTPELVQEIRASEETGRAIAKRMGVSEQLVSKIRTGKTWRDAAVPASSVFTWRPSHGSF